VDVIHRPSAEMGVAPICVSHDMSGQTYLTEGSAILPEGVIAEIGLTEDIVMRPVHLRARALLRAVPVPNPKLRRRPRVLEEQVLDFVHLPQGCRCLGISNFDRRVLQGRSGSDTGRIPSLSAGSTHDLLRETSCG
jgi:ABC-type dipeptide/oligopeptide/nickel transport system ATPase component